MAFKKLFINGVWHWNWKDKDSTFNVKLRCQYFMKVYPWETEGRTFWLKTKIMIEIKALTQLENVHLAQALNYLDD